MKAIHITTPGGPEVLKIGEAPMPQPGEKEVLVRVAATALNRADTLQREGKYPPPKGASPIPGLEMAGEVTAIGPGATRWKPGDKVCALLSGGGYAEYVTIHEETGIPVPEGFSMEMATAIPEVFLTAWQALAWLGNLKEQETILIHAGASGVGTAAIQIAKALGANVIVTASAPKHKVCLDLGATLAIDYKKVDFQQAVVEEMGSKGVNMILDFIAAPYFQKNLECLAIDGRMVMLALLGGLFPKNVNLGLILGKRLSIMGSTLRSRSLEYKIKLTRNFWDFAGPRFLQGTIKPIIDSVYDWTDVSEAHRRMGANLNSGKIILKVHQ